MRKKKILWVVYDFVQAGGQRYVYEICKALDKEKYEIDILRMSPINHDKNWVHEYYYEPSLALSCKILNLDDFLPREAAFGQQQSIVKRAFNFIYRKISLKWPRVQNNRSLHGKKKLASFLTRYDHINFAGVPVFKAVLLGLEVIVPNAIIHILTAKFQDNNLYAGLEKSKYYNFVSGIKEESIGRELEGFTNYDYTHFNICFETIPYEISRNEDNCVYKIAVFTRLSKMKPLDPYFYGLKMLKEQGINAELHIYGAGNPEELGLLNQLRYLYLAGDVYFHGHIEDIPKEIKNNPPHLLWFQSTNSQPAGYAALEISMSGLPQVFWDFMYMGHTDAIAETFASFTDLTSFVNYTKEMLLSSELQVRIGEKQRQYVLEHYSINKQIHILEKLFDK